MCVTDHICSTVEFLYPCRNITSTYVMSTHYPLVTPLTPSQDFVWNEVTAAMCHNKSRKHEHIGHPYQQPMQYIHIHKTGGTSIQFELEHWAERHKLACRKQDNGGPFWDRNRTGKFITGGMG